MPNPDDSLDEYNEWRRLNGYSPIGGGGPKRPRMLSLSNEAYRGLQRLANEYNVSTRSTGNVSALVELIGTGVFQLRQRQPGRTGPVGPPMDQSHLERAK